MLKDFRVSDPLDASQLAFTHTATANRNRISHSLRAITPPGFESNFELARTETRNAKHVSLARLSQMIMAGIATTAALLTVPTFTSSALAEDERPVFYSKDISPEWSVFGRLASDPAKQHDACSAQRLWPDGSYFQIRKDLNDDSVYLWIKNVDWSIADKSGSQYEVRINSFNERNQWVDGSPLTFNVIDKNSIFSINLKMKPFMTAVMASSFMKFVMPGSVQNFTVQFNNLGPQLISALAECINSSKNAGPLPEVKLPNLDSPRVLNSNKL